MIYLTIILYSYLNKYCIANFCDSQKNVPCTGIRLTVNYCSAPADLKTKIPIRPLNERERERERNVLFNDALNTFYLRLYGVRHMIKDHSDSEKGNPLPPHRLLFPISSKGSFICTIPQTG